MSPRLVPVLLAAAALLAAPLPAIAATHGQSVVHRNAAVCGRPTAHTAACAAIRHESITTGGQPLASTGPSGYGPGGIRSAYRLNGLTSHGRTVAIVDAYDDPTAEKDLGVYRSTYNLKPCTTANGCFKKVNQTGGKAYPPKDGGWAQEISLDLDMVSSACADCHILLVEANSNSFADLAAAVNYAASVKGVVAISNSYGGADSSPRAAYDHPGIAITASTGDSGYGISAPASFKSVIAVGGTSLYRAPNTSRGWHETAWNGAGSGCSGLNPKPSWQTAATRCSGKAAADVSAVADPNTGVAVYDSTAFQGYSGWMVFGGTSASSPIIAGVYALSGRTSGYPAQYTWSHRTQVTDIIVGSNGSCPTSVWCHAGTGWDGPTGLGTPKGVAAF